MRSVPGRGTVRGMEFPEEFQGGQWKQGRVKIRQENEKPGHVEMARILDFILGREVFQ